MSPLSLNDKFQRHSIHHHILPDLCLTRFVILIQISLDRRVRNQLLFQCEVFKHKLIDVIAFYFEFEMRDLLNSYRRSIKRFNKLTYFSGAFEFHDSNKVELEQTLKYN